MKVSDKYPKAGLVVKYQGIFASVTFNPYDKEDKDLGWFYTSTIHANTVFWRKIWECDEYEELYEEKIDCIN